MPSEAGKGDKGKGKGGGKGDKGKGKSGKGSGKDGKGGKGKGKYWERGWKSIQELYGFKDEEEAMFWKGNPIDEVHVLAQNGVRVMLGLAMKDTVVPAEEPT